MNLDLKLFEDRAFQESVSQLFCAVLEEYFEMDHAEFIPVADLQKPPTEVFYLPMHAVRKEYH